MKRNEGNVDRALRMLLGIVLLLLAASGTIPPWEWIGVLPLLTGLAGYCPLYRLLGWSTCTQQPPTA